MSKRQHLRRIILTKHKEIQKPLKEIEGRSLVLKENPTFDEKEKTKEELPKQLEERCKWLE